MKTIYRLEIGESVLIHTAEWFNINTYIIDHRKNTRSFTIEGYNLIVPEMFKYFGKIAKISRLTYNTDIEEFMYYIEGCDFLWDIRCFDINTPTLVSNSIVVVIIVYKNVQKTVHYLVRFHLLKNILQIKNKEEE